MQIARGMHILDLGCGTGTATPEITSGLDGTGKVVGLDLSEKMLGEAERKLAELGYTNVEFVLERASALEYEAYFDYVLSTNAFHHFGDEEEIFSQVWHYDSGFYHPPAGTDVVQWVINFVLAYDEIDAGAEIAGLPAVHLGTEASSQSYAYDEYYVIKDGQLFRIKFLHVGGQEDWELYNGFLRSFTFE